MPNVFEPTTAIDLLNRLNSLQPTNPRQWGTMNAAQMMAHCSEVFEMSLGDRIVQPRTLFMKVVSPFVKNLILSEKPYKKGLPTGKDYVIRNNRDFLVEQERLINLYNRFLQTPPETIAETEHPLIGKLTPEQWGFITWKHLDHHLKQFNA